MPVPPDTRQQILLSVQRALVGEVWPSIRAISVDISTTRVSIYAYWDGPIDADQLEEFDGGAITQVVADFPYPEHGDPSIRLRPMRCDAPQPIPVRGQLVYARARERFEPMKWTLGIKPRGIPERPDPPSEEPLKRPTGPVAGSASHRDRT